MSNEVWKEKNHEPYPKDVARRVDEFAKFANYFVGDRKTIADLGCGNKHLLIKMCLLADKAYNDIGMYDYYPVDEDVLKIDLNVYGNVATKYDLVYLSHVMEHLEDPIQSLNIIADEFLNDKGRLIFAVPLAEGDNGHRPFDESIGHISYFNRNNVEEYLTRSGFVLSFLVVNLIDHNFPELWVVADKE